jgi:16S rRNA (guanine1516-N2)-methyltransferase
VSARLRVTVSGQPEDAVREEARAFAQRLGVPFVDRRPKAPLHRLLETPADVLLVFEREHVALWDSRGTFRWSPGMAALRLLALSRGEPDNLVWAAQLRPGDEVLDCTLGLGQDALIASRAVGPSGRVRALEKSLPLLAVTDAGLRRLGRLPGACEIEVAHEDAAVALQGAPSRSVDVVLFDPMFGKPKKAQPSFEMLRRHAEHAPLTAQTLQAAARVARRSVVVKGARYSDDLRRLGLSPLPTSRYSALCWARVDAS